MRHSETQPKVFKIDDCREMISQGKFVQAARTLEGLLQGDDKSEASFLLSGLYAQGNGVTQDQDKAKELLRSAADLGCTEAQFLWATTVAPFKKHGKFNYEACAEALKRPYENGHARATLELGKLFFSGRGVDENRQKAIELINKAAELDSRICADSEIGQCHYSAMELDKALPYLTKAFNAGDPSAAGMLATYYARGVGGTDVGSDQQKGYAIAKAGVLRRDALSAYVLACFHYGEGNHAQSIKEYELAWEWGMPEAAYDLANLRFRLSVADKRATRDARKLLTEASRCSNLKRWDAMADLATCMYQGWGSAKDCEGAVAKFKTVLEHSPENSVALHGLGMSLIKGAGIEKDEKKGWKMVEDAAILGARPACLELASRHHPKNGTEPDPAKYAKYLELAADCEDDIANLELGKALASGTVPGISKNEDEAAERLARAALLGSPDAFLEFHELCGKNPAAASHEDDMLHAKAAVLLFSSRIVQKLQEAGLPEPDGDPSLDDNARAFAAATLANRFDADLTINADTYSLGDEPTGLWTVPDALADIEPAVSI